MSGACRKASPPQTGAWASLRPTLHVPVQARSTLWRVLPLNTATWALGGFYASLAPSLVRTATGSTSESDRRRDRGGVDRDRCADDFHLAQSSRRQSPAVGRQSAACWVCVLVLLGVHSASLPLFFLGTLVAGCGFGSGFLGAVRSLVPLAFAP